MSTVEMIRMSNEPFANWRASFVMFTSMVIKREDD
jgi:hypothetical protein